MPIGIDQIRAADGERISAGGRLGVREDVHLVRGLTGELLDDAQAHATIVEKWPRPDRRRDVLDVVYLSREDEIGRRRCLACRAEAGAGAGAEARVADGEDCECDKPKPRQAP